MKLEASASPTTTIKGRVRRRVTRAERRSSSTGSREQGGCPEGPSRRGWVKIIESRCARSCTVQNKVYVSTSPIHPLDAAPLYSTLPSFPSFPLSFSPSFSSFPSSAAKVSNHLSRPPPCCLIFPSSFWNFRKAWPSFTFLRLASAQLFREILSRRMRRNNKEI